MPGFFLSILSTKNVISLACSRILVQSPVYTMGPSTPKITNVYVVCVLATFGGLLQGFDVSTLSAILATKQVRPRREF